MYPHLRPGAPGTRHSSQLKSCGCCSCRSLRHNPDKEISANQLDILCLVGAGKTDREIGIILSVSAKTINYHVERLKQLLDVPTRVQLVIAAVHCGFLIVAESSESRISAQPALETQCGLCGFFTHVGLTSANSVSRHRSVD